MSPYYVILSRLCTLAARGGLSGRIPWTSAPFVVTLSGGAPTLAILQAVVDDAVAVLDCISGADPQDPTCWPESLRTCSSEAHDETGAITGMQAGKRIFAWTPKNRCR